MKIRNVILTFIVMFMSVQTYAKKTLINADAMLDVEQGKIVKQVSVLVENDRIIASC